MTDLLLHSNALKGFSSLIVLLDFQTLIFLFFFYIDELEFYKEKFPLLHLYILSIKYGPVIIYSTG